MSDKPQKYPRIAGLPDPPGAIPMHAPMTEPKEDEPQQSAPQPLDQTTQSDFAPDEMAVPPEAPQPTEAKPTAQRTGTLDLSSLNRNIAEVSRKLDALAQSIERLAPRNAQTPEAPRDEQRTTPRETPQPPQLPRREPESVSRETPQEAPEPRGLPERETIAPRVPERETVQAVATDAGAGNAQRKDDEILRAIEDLKQGMEQLKPKSDDRDITNKELAEQIVLLRRDFERFASRGARTA